MADARELHLVGDERGLAEVSAAVLQSNLVALDTEFVRERTYYPQLCLVQVATPDIVACVDMLAPLDFEPLYAALHRDESTWVLHSARQDLEVIGNASRRRPARLVDTQIAGALIGLPAQLGLQGLLEQLLAIKLDKTETRTDWSRRPLPDRAVRYALDDVRYLLPVWDELSRRLQELGRDEWLAEDCARVLESPPPSDAASIFERMRGTGSLAAGERSATLALVAWRENKAQALNRPRRWILADELVLRLARARPCDATALKRIPELPRKLVARWGRELVETLQAADTSEPDTVSPAPPVAKEVLKSLQAEARRRAAALGIEPEVLATRRELAQLAAGEPPPALADGWRAAQLRSS